MKHCNSGPLLTALNIDSVESICMKHKLFFYRQIVKSDFTKKIFIHLNTNTYNFRNASFIKQIKIVNNLIGGDCTNNIKESLSKISLISIISIIDIYL